MCSWLLELNVIILLVFSENYYLMSLFPSVFFSSTRSELIFMQKSTVREYS